MVFLNEERKGRYIFFRKGEHSTVSLSLKMYNCPKFIDFSSIHLLRTVQEIIALARILKFS